MGQALNHGHTAHTAAALIGCDGGDAAGTLDETATRSTSLFTFPPPRSPALSSSISKKHITTQHLLAQNKEAANTSTLMDILAACPPRHQSADAVLVGGGGRDSSVQARKRARLFGTTSAESTPPDLRSVWYPPNKPEQEQERVPGACELHLPLDGIVGRAGGGGAAAADVDAGGGGDATTDEETSANVIITMPPPPTNTAGPPTTAAAATTTATIPATATANLATSTATPTSTSTSFSFSAAPPPTTTTTAAAAAARTSSKATPRGVPLVERLSHKLVRTYQVINDNYYTTKVSKGGTSAASGKTGRKAGTKKRKKLRGESKQPDGRYVVVKGDVLGGRYTVESKLGSGTFGTVVAAWDAVANVSVAVKVVRKQAAFLRQAKVEARLLRELREKAPHFTFDLVDEFEWDNHTCFVFERAQINLYELVQMSSYRGVALPMVASIGRQLVRALDRFAQPDLNLIHADLKPENIMFTTGSAISSSDQAPLFGGGGGGGGGGSAVAALGATPASANGATAPPAPPATPPPPATPEVRLIDFGSSCTVGESMYTYIQSRYYRAPEVVLELPYDTKIDVWSLGCVLYELYTGDPLFRTKDAADHIYQIAAVCGRIPVAMLANAQRTDLFDAETGNATDSEAAARAARKSKGPLALLFASAAVGGGQGHGGGSSGGDAENAFLDLLQLMLAVDPVVRASPQELLQHPFFGGSGMGSSGATAAGCSPTYPPFVGVGGGMCGAASPACSSNNGSASTNGTSLLAWAGFDGAFGGAAQAYADSSGAAAAAAATMVAAAATPTAMSTTPPTTAVTAAAASAASIATPIKSKFAAKGVGGTGGINAAGFVGSSGISSLVAAAARLQQSLSG